MKKRWFGLVFCMLSIGLAGADLVENGEPRAVIVLPKSSTKAARFAVRELNCHIKKITGCELPVCEKAPSNAKSRIYVGENPGVPRNAEFQKQEFLVKVKGNEIFLTGHDKEDKTILTDNVSTWPGIWDERGTLHAVYEFLEALGVRWYLPTDLGITFEPTRNLRVKDMELRRIPSLNYRHPSWTLWPADLCGDTVKATGKSRNLSAQETILWSLRNRIGGTPVHINHSMALYYTRFPGKKEWLAQGYGTNKAPQLCYTNRELIQQVAQDARDYFDGKIPLHKVAGNSPKNFPSECFPVFPMDGGGWCKCEKCRKLIEGEHFRGEGFFSNGKTSNYFFHFVNEVAKEVKKTHPGKIIGAGAYATYAYPPTKLKLEDNVRIMLCMHIRLRYARGIQANEEKILREWQREYPHMKKYVWLYFCFPSGTATGLQTRFFPGFMASQVKDYFKLFKECNVKGIFMEPSYIANGQRSPLFDQLEGYINWKLAWDNTRDGQKLFDEFFVKYYGPAAVPMKQFYSAVEDAYTNPANWPPKAVHMTTDVSWNKLGNERRMKQLGEWMEKAEKLAVAEPFKSRVALFRKGVWDYMRKGKKTAGELQMTMSDSMQQASVPYLENPDPGNPSAIHWEKASVLNLYGGLRAERPVRNLDARVAHDGTWLYLSLTENNVNPAALLTQKVLWANDEWECYFGKFRGIPYRVLAVDAAGARNGVACLGTAKEGMDQFPGKVLVEKGKKHWRLLAAFPLEKIVDGGIHPGEMLYFNLIRSGNLKPLGCWIPTFGGYHVPERFGELYLEPRTAKGK